MADHRPAHTVLIADDDPGQLRLMELTLAGDNLELLRATDGHQALALARERRPAIVLLDWQMPGPSGIEVCLELRAAGHNGEMHIVMLTGRDSAADRDAALAAGADDYLAKPFSPLELLDKVTDALGPDVLA